MLFAAYAVLVSLVITGGALVLASILTVFAFLFQGVFSWITMVPLSPVIIIGLSISLAATGIGLAWLSVIALKALTHATRIMFRQLQRSLGGVS